MTASWPDAGLDPIRRLCTVAAGVPGASVTQRIIAAPYDIVWPLLTDFEDGFTQVQPDMRRVRVLGRRDDRVELLAVSRLGPRARLAGRVRPGWCWLQSRLLIIAMATRPEPDGRTLVALTGGVRIPGRAAIVPVGVRREAGRSLDRLERLVAGR